MFRPVQDCKVAQDGNPVARQAKRRPCCPITFVALCTGINLGPKFVLVRLLSFIFEGWERNASWLGRTYGGTSGDDSQTHRLKAKAGLECPQYRMPRGVSGNSQPMHRQSRLSTRMGDASEKPCPSTWVRCAGPRSVSLAYAFFACATQQAIVRYVTCLCHL